MRATFWVAVPAAIVVASCAADSNGDATSSRAARTSKMTAGLEISFLEPGSITTDVDLPVTIRVSGGAPRGRIALAVRGAPGVDVSAEDADLELDADGSGATDVAVRVPQPRGCYIVVHATTEDGRVQEAVCVLGGTVEGEPVGLETLPDGRRVRVDRSR